MFAKYEFADDEYALTLQMDLDEARLTLQRLGFGLEPVAALKKTSRDEIEMGSWVYRPRGPLSRFQYHAHLVEDAYDPEEIHVYGHHEYSWIRHPVKHYRPPAHYDTDIFETYMKNRLAIEDVDYVNRVNRRE